GRGRDRLPAGLRDEARAPRMDARDLASAARRRGRVRGAARRRSRGGIRPLMDCCTAHCEATGRLFGPKAAEGDLKPYRKNGPGPHTRMIIEELRRSRLEGASLLDVGGGIGVLGIELMASGIRRVTQVDASPAYLAASQRQFADRGWADRMEAIPG